MVLRFGAWALATVVLVACGDDEERDPIDVSPPDAGPEVIATPPAMPAEVVFPRANACLPGWSPVEEVGGSVCAPFEGGQAPRCGGAEITSPRSATCVAIGADCAMPYATDVNGTHVIYVDASATGSDGTGTRTSPYTSLVTALASASPGSVVSLAAGEYAGPIVMPPGVELVGACTEDVVLTSAGGDPAIAVPSGEAIVRRLRIASEAHAFEVLDGAALEIADVAIDRAGDAGAIVYGGSLHATRFAVREITPSARPFAVGIAALTGSVVTLEDASFEHVSGYGLYAIGAGSRIEATGLDIAGGRAVGESAGGLVAVDGASVHATELVVRQGAGFAMLVSGGELTVEDCALQRTPGGLAIDDGSASIARADLSVRALGFDVSGGVLDLEDTWLRDTDLVQSSSDRLGFGLIAMPAGDIHVARVAFLRTSVTSLLLRGDDVRLSGEDFAIVGVEPALDDLDGRAVNVSQGAELEVDHMLVDGSRNVGFEVNGYPYGDTPTSAIVRDLIVRNTGSELADGTFGVGVGAWNGASLEIERGLVSGNRVAGIVVRNEGSMLVARDLMIVGQLGRERDGRFGRGIEASDRGVAMLERVAILDNREFGIVAFEGSDVTARDLIIEDVYARMCEPEECPASFGIGIGSYGDAHVALDHFAIRRAALCGFHVDDGFVATGVGLISNNPIGACIESGEIALSDFGPETKFEANVANYDAPELPLPEIGAALQGAF